MPDRDAERGLQLRDACKPTPGKTLYRVDLTRTTDIDSAGLGMLLRLREFAGGDSRRVRLLCRPGVITEIFNVANFDCLFDIETVSSSY